MLKIKQIIIIIRKKKVIPNEEEDKTIRNNELTDIKNIDSKLSQGTANIMKQRRKCDKDTDEFKETN